MAGHLSGFMLKLPSVSWFVQIVMSGITANRIVLADSKRPSHDNGGASMRCKSGSTASKLNTTVCFVASLIQIAFIFIIAIR